MPTCHMATCSLMTHSESTSCSVFPYPPCSLTFLHEIDNFHAPQTLSFSRNGIHTKETRKTNRPGLNLGKTWPLYRHSTTFYTCRAKSLALVRRAFGNARNGTHSNMSRNMYACMTSHLQCSLAKSLPASPICFPRSCSREFVNGQTPLILHYESEPRDIPRDPWKYPPVRQVR
jgi:hypothetical protein